MFKRLILLVSFLVGIVLIQGVMAQESGFAAAGYRPSPPTPLPKPLDTNGRIATATISGRVFQADGTTPLLPGDAAVQVEDAFTGDYIDGVGLNADGTYTARDIPAGTYFVRASGPNYALAYYEDGEPTTLNATPIEVEDDQVITDIDFALDEGGRVTGIVYEEDGTTPLPYSPVRVADDILLVVCSDANGRYSMNSLPLDMPLRLYAGGANNCMGGSGDYVVEYWKEAADYASATPITLTTAISIQTGIDFSLAFGGQIAGTVFDTAGTTRLADILVTAEDIESDEFAGKTTTDANGNYTLTGLASGDYRVRAEGDFHVIEYYEEAGFNGKTATPVRVDLQQTTEGVDFTLEDGGRIKGVVTTADGTPLPRINVALSDDIWASTCTDVDGSFSLMGLPLETELHIYAGGQNYCQTEQLYVREWWQEADRLVDATPVVVPASGTVAAVNFTLVEGGSISGMVYEADGSTPVSGNVEVFVSDLGEPVEVARGFVSVNDGSYKLPALPAGTYAVFAKGNQYALQFYDNAGISLASATPVTVSVNDNTSEINFALLKAGSVIGTVRDTDTQTPLANTVVGVEGAAWLTTCTDENGIYTLASIPHNLPVKVYAGGAKCDVETGDYLREWWEEKSTAALADAITLTPAQSTRTQTDFTLAKQHRVFVPIVHR